MAASSFLLIVAVAVLAPPALSLTCTSQKFPQSTKFANCIDLPALKAFLHWTHDPAAKPNPTLSIAFIAPPAKPDGWVAWALNPAGSGMLGAQSLVAFKGDNGSVVVKTYNISSYGPISESKISFEVLDKRAESSGGEMRIFATLALPARQAEANQVWQVGLSVRDGVPVKHDVAPDNLRSKGKLQLDDKADAPKGEVPAASHGGNDAGGNSRVVCGGSLGMYGILVLLGISFLGF